MISVCINTACLGDPRTKNSQGVSEHSKRTYALRNFIIPFYVANASQVIVTGEFEDGEGYTYIPAQSLSKNCIDALHARQLAFEAAKGDTIVFQHDDHILDTNWWLHLDKRYDVISPSRWRRANGAAIRLNNGEPQAQYPDGYVSGHCAIYKREVIERCPWENVPLVHTWDVMHTYEILACGFSVHFSDQLRVWDVET